MTPINISVAFVFFPSLFRTNFPRIEIITDSEISSYLNRR